MEEWLFLVGFRRSGLVFDGGCGSVLVAVEEWLGVLVAKEGFGERVAGFRRVSTEEWLGLVVNSDWSCSGDSRQLELQR
ncbi:unnamed protein product [Dovyalis caffra]|uniref:Uncharacterized protein n=1 Tax=Dovyalis caffra TaxID=77055 RepID=A0AAV1RXS5_9ROSI|nr:unnamed protein product [Dovyalis caffra]